MKLIVMLVNVCEHLKTKSDLDILLTTSISNMAVEKNKESKTRKAKKVRTNTTAPCTLF